MVSLIGQTVSHYKILEKLGEGGMGVVYKAQDLKLERLVAVKFLPPHLGSDEEEKQRFIHEAKAASALDHNNICTIHEVDATLDGQTFIVMAYYEGQTLKKRIERGPLKIDETIGIAIQIAQGLGKAHEQAIVHRDIKPANVVLTKDGVAKIVDFGLAKLRGQTVLTKAGTTMGTVLYMSPEQARGEPADHRSDIWAMGTVVYEMVTGRPPFHGDYENAIVYGILNATPEPMSALRTGVPLELERIVSKSLAKDPEERYQHADELVVDLKRLKKETAGVKVVADQNLRERAPTTASTSMTPLEKASLFSKRKMLAVIALFAIAVIMFLLFVLPKRGLELNPNAVTRTISIPLNRIGYPALSPDGNWIAISASDARDRFDVYLMNLSGGEPRRVTFDSSAFIVGTDISDDGAMIVYTRNIRLNRPSEIVIVPSLGGSEHLLVPEGLGGSWMPQHNRISYLPHALVNGMPGKSGKFELWSVAADGSDPRQDYIDTVGFDWSSVMYSWSPDGKSFAFIRTFIDGSKEVVVHECETGKERQLTFDRKYIDEVKWTHDDQIIYSSTKGGKTDLWLIPANGGEPLQLTRGSGSVIQGRITNDGRRLMYYEQNITSRVKIGNLKTGAVQQLTNDVTRRYGVDFSPDGRYLAFIGQSNPDRFLPANDLIILDRQSQQQRRLLSGKRWLQSLAWSPDGERIAWETSSDSVAARHEIYAAPAMRPGPTVFLGNGTGPYWFDSDTVAWYGENKTWKASATDPHPVQFYRDSFRAYSILGGKYVYFRDVAGDRWVDMAPGQKDPAKKQLRLILKEPWPVRLIKQGREMFAIERPGKLVKLTLPEVKQFEIPFEFPGLGSSFSVSNDGKEVAYVEIVYDTKLILVDNPFK